MKVLVVAAHPDDEAIGCGGQIALHKAAGDEVLVLFMTAGELGCPGMSKEDTSLLRIHEGYEASKVLGSTVIEYWQYPDGGLEANDETIVKFAKLCSIHKPNRIYVTSDLDAHVDHQAAANIVKQAVDKSFMKSEVWCYEVWTPLPRYDEVVDITSVIGIKQIAIRRHESQVNRIRFDESSLSLARFRGELHNRPHGPYAEVYKVER